MEIEDAALTEHDKFKELCALANTGTLTPGEWAELSCHLQICASCREIHSQYLLLVTKGIPLLSARYDHAEHQETWDERRARRDLVARVQEAGEPSFPALADRSPLAVRPSLQQQIKANRLPIAFVALAACLVIAAVSGVYRRGNRTVSQAEQAQLSVNNRVEKLATEKKAIEDLLAAETRQVSQLREKELEHEQELARLRSALKELEVRATELESIKGAGEEQLRQVSQQRDSLIAQLQDAEDAYHKAEAQFTSLRAERDKAALSTASLEARIEELTAATREQELKIRDDEEYLASDRDIRELIGARKLYIADVFDVDSHSRTRQPFGRVFFTEGKSLIFYAFDLDRRPGIKNSNTFQAWGRKETGTGKPLSLGILYMDNEANRRWVLRCDDPVQLAKIDAVFVTVEPHGGSPKPTGKPYLYALLRKEANHP